MHGNPVPDTYVYVTEEGVTRHYADGSVEALAWEDVVEVRVGGHERREPSGQPDDVFIVLLDRAGEGCVVPHSATDASFLARLRYLPDFDLDRLSTAVAGAHADYVVVWRSPEPPSPLPDLEYD
ncbi:hypothetical protein AB0C10_04145 [Microbispora amethystogenes]|uniref:Uncharacterized protein n=2 Tax=Microbispora TaxID=2005 RepID=A0A5J5JXL2_9ACTN|nr:MULTISPECIES: hypothetical protein [Microbispora]KAA9376434.1 hypothetical protein F5972_23770 [Microbispora cellulosiformans]GIH32800.1 hypothetical protein Mam01_29640 [Microbispora amethystogenes]